MRLVCLGDSWTEGYGISDKNDTYPYILSKMLNRDCVVLARNGNDNLSILSAFKNISIRDTDILIIGWSGISRFYIGNDAAKQFSLSYVPQENNLYRKSFFESHDIDFLRCNWQNQLDYVHQYDNAFSFSVFGDKPLVWHKNMIKDSYLIFLANESGINFEYDIDIFEFDFLHELNNVAEHFFNKHNMPLWQKACVEREKIRPSKYFFNCGHPNEEGHKIWAQHLFKVIMNGHH